MRRALAEVEASDDRAEEESEGDSFVDIMGSLDKETGGESEGFTFADILRRNVKRMAAFFVCFWCFGIQLKK